MEGCCQLLGSLATSSTSITCSVSKERRFSFQQSRICPVETHLFAPLPKRTRCTNHMRKPRTRTCTRLSHDYQHDKTGLDVQPRKYNILTKSRIRDIFDKYAGPGMLDHRPFFAAASVLPMRTNNYVVGPLLLSSLEIRLALPEPNIIVYIVT